MKVSILDSLSPRTQRIVKWCVGLFLAYTLLGFLILPPIIRAVAAKQLSKQLDREVSIQKVKLNPFTHLAITYQDGTEKKAMKLA